MTTQLTKKQLAAKISKEQGVDPKSLERLNLAALQAMDKVVPDVADEGDLLGGDISNDESTVASDESGSAGSSDVGDGVQESDSEVDGNGTVDSPELGSGVSDNQPSVSSADSVETKPDIQTTVENTPAVPSENGTTVVGDVAEEGVQIPPSETPFPSNELENQEGQGDASEHVPPEAPAAHVLIGEHPATGEPVYADEQ